MPRRYTFEIEERVDADGSVSTPLDETAVRAQLAAARPLELGAVSVCLLWATANPAHELKLGELIEAELPGVPYSLSHEVNPIVREYRRASSAAIDASLKPLMQRHLPEISTGLEAEGFAGELLAATTAGGVVPMQELIDSPLLSVRSGPSLAPVAARTVAAAETGSGDVIVCDTGGTSFDVGLVRGGELVFTNETWLGEPFAGHLTGLSSVDIRSIGAGGGSIAWVDPGGLLRVGPESAGADPGPACYGRGGTRPTVTDAALMLGYIDPDNFLGGAMKLDLAAAEAALEGLAEALGVGVKETAAGGARRRQRADDRGDPGTDRERGRRPARQHPGRRRRRRRADDPADRQGARLPRRSWSRAPPACSRPSAASTPTSSARSPPLRRPAPRLRLRRRRRDGRDPAREDRAPSRRRCASGPRRSRRIPLLGRVALRLPGLGHPDPAGGGGGRRRRGAGRLVESFHDAHERIFAVREPGQKVEILTSAAGARHRDHGEAAGRRQARGAVAGDGVRRPPSSPSSARSRSPSIAAPSSAPGAAVQGPVLIDRAGDDDRRLPGRRPRTSPTRQLQTGVRMSEPAATRPPPVDDTWTRP